MSLKKLKKNEVEDIGINVEIEEDIIVKEATNHYVDGKKFKELIISYYESGVFSEELGIMIDNISNHVAFRSNFRGYTFLDEMISDSNFKMVKALNQKKYDTSKGDPFGYFSKICFRAFINIIKKENKNHDTIRRYRDDMFDELVYNGLVGCDNGKEIDNGN